MDKSNYKWVYPVPQMYEESKHTQWVWEVNTPEPGVEQIWLVDSIFSEEHYQHVEWILFVGPDRKDSQYTKKVYVAGWDPYYDNEISLVPLRNRPRKLRKFPYNY